MKSLIILSLMISSFAVNGDAGKKVFTKVCAACHTIGMGDKTGPDLAGLSTRRKFAWIKKFISYPEGMINGDAEEAGYEKPDALAKKVYNLYKPTMMAEQELTDVQLKAVLKYIESLKKQPKGKITTLK